MKKFLMFLSLCVVLLVGCAQRPTTREKSDPVSTPPNTPEFSLAWSEYPSWSVFGVLGELGAIDPRKGYMGQYETKYNVDIVLTEADYDPCISMYNSGAIDAVCVTNMDILNTSTKVSSVAICPTSTSVGGDALIVTSDIKSIEDLKNHPIYGLELSVAPYCFYRNLEIRGIDTKDYKFTSHDPGAAAQAMQQGQEGYKAIQVWNPFVNQTLKTTPSARVLTDKDGKPFDSSTIPGEIVDMVVISKKSLAREGGKNFALAICDAYYNFNGMLNDASQKDALLVALGAKFSTMNAKEMSKCLEQTKFYSTPTQGSDLFQSDTFHKTMDSIVPWCKNHGYFTSEAGEVSVPTIGFSDGLTSESNLTFDSSFMESLK